MRILLSAAEASSDRHGAKLVESMRAELAKEGKSLEVFGIGGEELRAQGMETVLNARDFSSMGFLEVISRLPRILKALETLDREVERRLPDLAILIDYPDFHFRFAKKLKKRGIPTIDFIPPKVWIWRSRRVRFIRDHFFQVLCIFPFEIPFLKSNGVNALYVGNPLLDELPLQATREEAKKKLGLSHDVEYLALLPGSRPAELNRHFELFLNAAVEFVKTRKGKVEALLSFPVGEPIDIWRRRLEAWRVMQLGGSPLSVRLSQGDSEWVLRASSHGIIKSGTSTLEAALLELPHVVVYKPNFLTTFLVRKVVGYKGAVGLSNLVLSREKITFPECLAGDATPEKIAGELANPRIDPDSYLKIREILAPPSGSPSTFAARSILDAYVARGNHSSPMEGQEFSWKYAVGSFLWAIVNSAIRSIVQACSLHKSLGARTISIGNIEAGGTGKTPLTIYLAQEAIQRGEKVAVLTRGYGGEKPQSGKIFVREPGDHSVPSPSEWGDETALLASALPGAWIGVGKSRIKSAAMIRKISRSKNIAPPTLYLLEDGFQQFFVRRELDLIVRTSLSWGKGWFRDFVSEIPDDALQVWTKGENPPEGLANTPSVRAQIDSVSDSVSGKNWLVSGVGRPDELLASLKRGGIKIERHFPYPDHHAYSEKEVRGLLENARSDGAMIFLTEKDAVKWGEILGPLEQHHEVTVLKAELRIVRGQEVWNRALWRK